MKQTAVEYLYETIDNELIDFLDNRIDLNELSVAMLKAKAIAKQMEKEQMEKCYDHGTLAYLETGHGDLFEDYFNKIYEDK